MTAAEVAALRERLSRGFEDAGEFTVVVDKADLRAALALIVRLTADLPDDSSGWDAAVDQRMIAEASR